MSHVPVQEQYEAYPYPRVPLIASISPRELWQINVPWILGRASQEPIKSPRIWIAGCGTFQPYLFAQANPTSEIIATDISRASLRLAENRCRVYRTKQVRFQWTDLMSNETCPEGMFDYIECYGVLMNVPDPALVLRNMVSRLNPSGVLRVMVYPHYGRQRIFQIQKLAKLLGFSFRDPRSPRQLKQVMKSLPGSHPLRQAFFSYADSKNDAGIVDGFLHASDRGFTGIEFADLLDAAGLELAFCVHRPWGQPRDMADRLGLSAHDPALWLHYLDLWQELRSNYVLCLVKKDASARFPEGFRHPLFMREKKSIRMAVSTLVGTKIQDRMEEATFLSGRETQSVLRGDAKGPASRRILLKDTESRIGKFFQGTPRHHHPRPHFVPRLGERAPNPLYAHLFDAYLCSGELGGGFPGLKEQITRWKRYAAPLESDSIPFGLTPFGTYEWDPVAIERATDGFRNLTETTFEDCRIENEDRLFRDLKKHLGRFVPESSPKSVLRELAVLVCCYNQMFLNFEPSSTGE